MWATARLRSLTAALLCLERSRLGRARAIDFRDSGWDIAAMVRRSRVSEVASTGPTRLNP
jgi:hypothetical protein